MRHHLVHQVTGTEQLQAATVNAELGFGAQESLQSGHVAEGHRAQVDDHESGSVADQLVESTLQSRRCGEIDLPLQPHQDAGRIAAHAHTDTQRFAGAGTLGHAHPRGRQSPTAPRRQGQRGRRAASQPGTGAYPLCQTTQPLLQAACAVPSVPRASPLGRPHPRFLTTAEPDEGPGRRPPTASSADLARGSKVDTMGLLAAFSRLQTLTLTALRIEPFLSELTRQAAALYPQE
jgi:hypothetical protein